MVRQARNRQLLTRANKGMPGGELTPRAIELLGELGVEPGSDRIVADGSFDPPTEVN